ncbi:MAG TPA: MFS transporter [Patescibacteria group bacterium]|jgi:MFS family permease|nr:MFS transporter [Patescibacteria group bacterium]
MKENLILRVLRIRPFAYLIASEFFSQFSMNLLNFSLLLIVFSVANSNSAVSGVVLAFTIPSILFGIFAGVLVDRWNKKTVLFATNLIRAMLIVPLAFFHTNLAVIYAVTFGVSVVTQFFIPAETPIIPLLVGKPLLLSANALFGMGIYASIFLAYAMSGPFLYLFGQSYLFIFLSILFLIAGIFAFLIKGNKSKIEPKRTAVVLGFKEEISVVLKLISQTKALSHALFSLVLAQILILVLAVIGPGYATHILRIRIESFPTIFMLPAVVGLTVGALIIGSFLHKKSKSALTKFGMLLMGISILLLPYGSRVESREIIHFINFYLPHILRITMLHITVCLAFLLGFATSFVFVPSNAVLQEETSDEWRGKVYGLLNSLVGVTSIIPVVVVGGLADLIGVKLVITGTGIVVILIALVRIFITDRG